MFTDRSLRSLPVVPATNSVEANTRLSRSSKLRWFRQNSVAWLLVPVIAAVSFVAISGSTAPNIPAIVLSSDPLYAAAAGDKPVLALALSVEFPTVGAQYVDVAAASTDGSYSNTNEYLGYYDAESCYTYKDAPTETPVAPQTTADFKRFDRSGAATNRMCSNAFSGNFLNWASNSAIDMLRLSLTGGDRYIDTSSLTILQRAVIPNGDPICMWNSSNFPAKQLKKSGGTSGADYFGAVPTAMATAAGTNDIWIANTLNRIYFGTSSGGGCGNTGSYTLGVAAASSSNQMGPITASSASLPSGATLCASENGTCSGLSGTQEIWYGATTHWKVAPATGSVSCSNGVFGDPIVGIGKHCYYRNYSGSWTPTASTTGLNSDGFFYSRVQVCNVDSSNVLQDVRDYGLCKKFPNGNYKPTGAVQKYSDQLRLAAFGYLMDQTASYSSGRYGGVLRAPMKYVGGRTFDINGFDNTPSGGNPKREWDESTGVFFVNPESNATFGKSGVVTYVNQFGRTGPVAGRYKKYDPVGELHYEALRYLQGLQPSADAVSGTLTADMYDGYPVETTWTDPYGGGRSSSSDYSCLKSNIVVIGDINTHDGNRLPTASAANNIPDINYWRGIVQSFEKDQSTAYTDGQGVARTTGNPNGANNSVPTGTTGSQIMGSAYWAHTHDIRGAGWTAAPTMQRPGLRVKTFLFDVNEYAAQNNATTRRTANQFFMAAKYGGFEADPSNLSKNPYNTWGNPFKRDDGTVDKYVWEDTDPRASRVGEANTYFLQSEARGVLSAFDDIFSRASTAARSIAGSAIASKSLTQAGSTIYQGTFDTSNWTGDLLAIPVSVNSSNVVSVSATPTWTAAAQLSALSSPATSRNIVVGNVGATANPVAAPFTWTDIEASLKTALDISPLTAAADGLAHDRLDYLRGDNSKEGSVFRSRNGKLLGDIINSGVVYSGKPTTSISSSSYATFYTANQGRTAAVFVGANDGMLHAFSATSGDELFAYIPSWLGPKLPALTSTTYANSHQSYVDGTPVVAEAEVGPAWKTVLVSGTGGGGQGVFALDVTNPSSFSKTNVMWEFTHDDDVEMGYVVGRPAIVKMRTSAPNVAAAYKWFAVVGGGVNSYIAPIAGNFGTGNPALFLLDLSKPAGTAWILGTNYYKISFPFDSTLGASKATGLINFKPALGAAGEVTQIFAGDLHGNLWKLDFSNFGTTDWNIGNLSPFNKGTTADPIPLFIAKDGSGNVQPITMAPSIAYGPSQQSSYVLFGTGKYMEVSDKSSTAQQSFYMVFDDGSSVLDSTTAAAATSAISGRGRLQAGTATVATGSTPGTVSISAFTLGRATSDGDTTQRSGWYFDFPTTGERQISSAALLANETGGSAVFGSLIPGAASAGSCASSGGGGNVYEVEIANGNGTSNISNVGLLGEPLLSAVTSAAVISPSDNTGRRKKTIKTSVIQQGSMGIPSAPSTKTTTITVGRLSWRQINNYQDLKNAP